MEAMNVLDKVTEAIERVLKGTSPSTNIQKMTPEALVSYAVAQIEKAAKEPPEKAARRLRALGQTVDAAKQAFASAEGETVEVAVFEEETTAAADKSEKETSLIASGQALGNSAFAQNAEDLHKALARVAKELGALRGDGGDGGGEGADSKPKVAKADDVAWPLDMNTEEFRDGVTNSEDKPGWGTDPEGIRTGGR